MDLITSAQNKANETNEPVFIIQYRQGNKSVQNIFVTLIEMKHSLYSRFFVCATILPDNWK